MNSTEETRARLQRAGVRLPSAGALLSAGEFVARYLDPIAALPELRGRIHEFSRVAAVARDDIAKPDESPSPDGPGRARRPFLLRVEARDGVRFENADRMVDATGIATRPTATGPGGLEAAGEAALGAAIDHRLLPSAADVRTRYGGRRALLIGSGHSAATALVVFERLAREGRGPSRVHWVHRDRAGEPFEQSPDDPLPARAALAREANRIAAGASFLHRMPGFAVLAYESRPDGAVRVRLRSPGGAVEAIEVDRVYALTGYRPDNDLHRELQVHLCYATEGPMALAGALLAARLADPARAGDCMAQSAHGAETLRTTEPGFFILGAKSYGRSPGFLLRVGYEQVRELMGLLALSRAPGGVSTTA
jgi:hypothetical protein